jgi:hypothetical protein
MKLDQLSARYHPTQDRILLRMNTADGDELRLWLTRRLCLNLWPKLKTIVADRIALEEGARDPSRAAAATADGQTRQMLADFHRQKTLEKADFKTPFRSDPRQLPLGSEPLLVSEVGFTPLGDGRLQIAFKEKLPGQPKPRSFRVSLQGDNLQGLLHLIDKALDASGWFASTATAHPESGAAPTDARPRYLN